VSAVCANAACEMPKNKRLAKVWAVDLIFICAPLQNRSERCRHLECVSGLKLRAITQKGESDVFSRDCHDPAMTIGKVLTAPVA
jgi:hypothetical protein